MGIVSLGDIARHQDPRSPLAELSAGPPQLTPLASRGVCTDEGRPRPHPAHAPREATGEAVDPIVLEPVDEVVVTTLVDNNYDA